MGKQIERYSTFRGAKVVKVIRLEVNEGTGVEGDPVRRVTYYLDFDGNILGHDDAEYEVKFRGDLDDTK